MCYQNLEGKTQIIFFKRYKANYSLIRFVYFVWTVVEINPHL